MWQVKEVTKEQEEWILANLYYSDTSKTGLRCTYSTRNNKRKANDEVFVCVNEAGYYQGAVLGKTFAASRIVYFLLHKEWVDYVKHMDGNPLNNTASNLRRVDKPRGGLNNGEHNVHRFRSREQTLVWQNCFIAQSR